MKQLSPVHRPLLSGTNGELGVTRHHPVTEHCSNIYVGTKEVVTKNKSCYS